jgi:type I restriction enzyme M protein
MVADFLTGKIVRNTPEEYVRQNIERALVVQYGYARRDAEPEFTIRVGSSRKRVDVSVFRAGHAHTQDNLAIIVETKRPGVKTTSDTEGVGQLKSYLASCVNAQYGMWTNGAEARICMAKRQTDVGFEFDDRLVDIPAFGQRELDAQRPKKRDLKPATADNLLFAFRRCHNYIAANEGKQKPEAFWELLKIIFGKIEDERSAELSFFTTPQERGDATSAGAAKARLQDLFISKVIGKYPTIFGDNDHAIDLRPGVAAFVVSQLQGFSLLGSPVDVKGVAYEEIVGANLRGDRGEFFTPRNACQAAVTMLDPRPGLRILDPACGTGGFLITAMNHALAHIETEHRRDWTDPSAGTPEESLELYRARDSYLSDCVFGIDLNPGLARAAKMNMVMNNDGSGGLWQANSLDNPMNWDPELHTSVPLGSVDIVVTNPPFGANIIIDDHEILRQYDLAARWDQDDNGKWRIRPKGTDGQRPLQRSQPPEILFIERCVQFLKPGTGRMIMVIPNGILNNPSTGYVRQWLLENTQIIAVVDMNRDLFQPKNDTQTSLLALRRLSKQEKRLARDQGLDYPIFMAVAETIGHDKRGNVVYKRASGGGDLLVDREEIVTDFDDAGTQTQRVVVSQERQVDDELPVVAAAFRRRLGAQVG